MSPPGASRADGQRIDKWLWYGRFIKSRTSAARFVSDGKVRVNRVRIAKPGHLVYVGDVITFTAHRKLHVVRIVAPGTRRGPAPEAQLLYEDLSPRTTSPKPEGATGTPQAQAVREEGSGRPTKKQRRELESWLEQER